ncbi:uncharacterized protein VTP21DRAFT_5019 [Calcarisporiella thermophila]|uniref:uncharacterized protein n=1 Tax=Calcarisporiella thermophila TaxID=911321 RepID=UPI003741F34F
MAETKQVDIANTHPKDATSAQPEQTIRSQFISAGTSSKMNAVDPQILHSDDPLVLAAELERVQDLIREQELSIQKLKLELEIENGHTNALRHDNQMLRQITVDMHAHAEQEEEYICNRLLRRIAGLKREKSELLVQVEREEEYMTNMLQKKLYQLQKEKVDMENQLEQEQEYIVNRLQKQLDALQMQSPVSPTSMNNKNHKWPLSHSPTSSSSEFGGAPSQGVVEMLKSEVNSLRQKADMIEKEYVNKLNQIKGLKTELIDLRRKDNLPVDDLLTEETVPSCMTLKSPSPRYGHIPQGPPAGTSRSRSTSKSSSRSSLDGARPTGIIGTGTGTVPMSIPFGESPRTRSVSCERGLSPNAATSSPPSRRFSGGLYYDQPRGGVLGMGSPSRTSK